MITKQASDTFDEFCKYHGLIRGLDLKCPNVLIDNETKLPVYTSTDSIVKCTPVASKIMRIYPEAMDENEKYRRLDPKHTHAYLYEFRTEHTTFDSITTLKFALYPNFGWNWDKKE